MSRPRWGWVVLAWAATSLGCAKRSQGEECLFNGDCVGAFVCAGHRCRAQCATDRDCDVYAPGAVCVPSDDPQKRVCLPRSSPTLCSGDRTCPAGSACLGSTCVWLCRDDAACAAQSAGACALPEGYCTAPVTAQVASTRGPQGGPVPDLDASLPDASDVADAADAPDVSTCAPGTADCDGRASNGCEVNTLTRVDHCGACMNACDGRGHADPVCVAGRCEQTCHAGYADCNGDATDGCEADLQYDPDHCTACGMRCSDQQACVAGACVAFPLAASEATEDLHISSHTVIPSGVHVYRSVIIDPNIRVTTTEPGVLEIYARGSIHINGVIDVSGGRGGDGAAPDPVTCAGGGGRGGETGTSIVGASGSTACPEVARGGQGEAGGDGAYRTLGCGQGGAFGGGNGGSPMEGGATSLGGGGGGGGGFAGGGGGGGFGDGATGGAGGGRENVGAGGTSGGAGGGNSLGGGGGQTGATVGDYVGRSGAAGEGGGGGGGSISRSAANDLAVASTLRPGSAGGGGGAYGKTRATPGRCTIESTSGGGGGGGGGGALRLVSTRQIVIARGAQLLANGGAGGDVTRAAAGACAGAGGGGSGGVIVLVAPRVTNDGVVSAAGGAGGTTPVAGRGTGGAGGRGRIRVSTVADRCSGAGSWTPGWGAGVTCTESTSTCGGPSDGDRVCMRPYPN